MRADVRKLSCATWLICGAISLGCDDSGESPLPEDNGVQQWVRRFVPAGVVKHRPDDRWRPAGGAPRVRETSPGMVVFEVSQYPPGSTPTAEQQRAVDAIVERCFAAAKEHGWNEFERGLADGFRKIDEYHYRNDTFMLDNHIVNPDRPEVLMYYATPPDGEQKLAGFMFYARRRDERGPQFGGPSTIWHYHSWFRPQCVVDGLSLNWSIGGKCERGVPSHFSGEMIHVWLIDHPDGRFATPMFLPYSVLGPQLDKRFRKRGF